MDNQNSVIMTRDYGHMSFHFSEVMAARNMSRNRLATLAGVRFEVVNRLHKGVIERMDMDVLARVCFALDCQVSDVVKHNKPS